MSKKQPKGETPETVAEPGQGLKPLNASVWKEAKAVVLESIQCSEQIDELQQEIDSTADSFNSHMLKFSRMCKTLSIFNQAINEVKAYYKSDKAGKWQREKLPQRFSNACSVIRKAFEEKVDLEKAETLNQVKEIVYPKKGKNGNGAPEPEKSESDNVLAVEITPDAAPSVQLCEALASIAVSSLTLSERDYFDKTLVEVIGEIKAKIKEMRAEREKLAAKAKEMANNRPHKPTVISTEGPRAGTGH